MTNPISKRRPAPSFDFPFFIWKKSQDKGALVLIGIEASEDDARATARRLSKHFLGVNFGFLDRSLREPTKTFPVW